MKKTTIILAAAFALAGHLFAQEPSPTPPPMLVPPPITPAQQVAKDLKASFKPGYKEQENFYNFWMKAVWKNDDPLFPVQVAEALGTDGAETFRLANQQKLNLLALNPAAEIFEIPEVYETSVNFETGIVTVIYTPPPIPTPTPAP